MAINSKKTDILVFSFVGYDAQEMAVGNKTQFDVVLKSQSNMTVVMRGSVRESDLEDYVNYILLHCTVQYNEEML